MKTLTVTLHFGIDWQNFSCAFSCNAVFSKALLLPQILQEICNRWVREPHALLEGSMPAFNVVIDDYLHPFKADSIIICVTV